MAKKVKQKKTFDLIKHDQIYMALVEEELAKIKAKEKASDATSPEMSVKKALRALVNKQDGVCDSISEKQNRVYVTKDVYDSFHPLDHLDIARTRTITTRWDEDISYIEIVRAKAVRLRSSEGPSVPVLWYLCYDTPTHEELKKLLEIASAFQKGQH